MQHLSLTNLGKIDNINILIIIKYRLTMIILIIINAMNAEIDARSGSGNPGWINNIIINNAIIMRCRCNVIRLSNKSNDNNNIRI
jgi:hypothetical protein